MKFWLILLSAVLLAGIIIGTVTAIRMPEESCAALSETVQNSITAEDAQIQTFFKALLQNGMTVLPLCLLGLTVFGALGAVAAVGAKGYAVGLSVGFLIRQYGMKGFAAAAGGVLPHTLLYLPGYLLLSIFCARFSIGLLQGKRMERKMVFSYFLSAAVLCLPILAGCATEGFLAANILKSILKSVL